MSPITLARRRVLHLLRHTYVRVATIDALDDSPPAASPAEDAYGDPLMVQGDPEPPRKCLYDHQSSDEYLPRNDAYLRTDHGTLEVYGPMLYVAHDDPLKPGDEVRNVTDAEGRVYVLSAQVEMDSSASSSGPAAYRAFRLREVKFP
jgi:hypothetical protein